MLHEEAMSFHLARWVRSFALDLQGWFDSEKAPR
jgi:hypothetical protein